MTEQERVQKQVELKMNCLNELLTKEMDKSKLLENQLADNLKKVRMLTTGTTTLDHLLTIGQCPSSNWGLGFQGATSKSAEETVFVKGSSNEKEIQTTTKYKWEAISVSLLWTLKDILEYVFWQGAFVAVPFCVLHRLQGHDYQSHKFSLSQTEVLSIFCLKNMAVSIARFQHFGSNVFGPLLLCLTGLVSMIRVIFEECMMQLSSSVTSLSLSLSLSLSPAQSISLTSNMQPTRRSSRLMKLKNVEATPMNTFDLSSGSSSRKRSRRRVSAGDTASLPKNVELEVESLSDGESSDDHSDEAPMAADTPPNRSKEQRFEESRNLYQTKAQFYPELMRPTRMPMTERFFSIEATERFRELRGRNFIPQQSISLTDENLSDVIRIVIGAGLIHTLTDLDPYQPNVIREFLANLPEAEERDDGVAVYVRGFLVDFSPSLINSMYCIPGFEEDPNWMDERLDEVCGFLTDGRIRRGENMSSKYLTATNQVLYKLVCSNWIPTRNYTSMNQRRLRFVYMLHHHDGFDFGKLVIHFQRTITPDLLHDEFTGTPKLVVKDVKAGRGSGADSSAASLEDDINRTIAGLKAIR
ncbi:hypothetical protein IGI04_023170, partial [Brassica rapa subsp. trilocularis]